MVYSLRGYGFWVFYEKSMVSCIEVFFVGEKIVLGTQFRGVEGLFRGAEIVVFLV